MQFCNILTGKYKDKLQETGFSCHYDVHSDVCVSTKQLRIDIQNRTIYVFSNKTDSETKSKQFIMPYPKKKLPVPRKFVHPLQVVQVTNTSLLRSCKSHHMVGAIVFSSGGFAGNSFHDFSDIIIPLLITSRHFWSQVEFLITDFKPWWVRKYDCALKGLSRFGILNAAKDGGVRCFPGGVICLKYHKILGVNTIDVPGGYKFYDFN